MKFMASGIIRRARAQFNSTGDRIAYTSGRMTLRSADAAAPTPDAALLIDVDLSIFGAPAQRFDEYERQVRREYSWVPGFLFRVRRRKILEAFLFRPKIYQTERFRESLEERARANLQRSIRLLGG